MNGPQPEPVAINGEVIAAQLVAIRAAADATSAMCSSLLLQIGAERPERDVVKSPTDAIAAAHPTFRARSEQP